MSNELKFLGFVVGTYEDWDECDMSIQYMDVRLNTLGERVFNEGDSVELEEGEMLLLEIDFEEWQFGLTASDPNKEDSDRLVSNKADLSKLPSLLLFSKEIGE